MKPSRLSKTPIPCKGSFAREIAAFHVSIFGSCLALSFCLPLNLAAAAVAAREGKLEIPTYPWSAVEHPYFQGTDKVNIYPYPMLDYLSREKGKRTYRTVVLENEYLRITFLPELGGKIHEVIDKTSGQPMFYVNHVIKPGLIGQCGAWTSGGVEWNTGPQGHTVGCMQPVEVRILPVQTDGSRSVAIGETERIYGTKWTVTVTLRPGRSFIEERIRIYNPTQTVRPYYFWNCTAAPNTAGFRFIYPMTLGMDHSGEKFFHWPIDTGRDLRYGTNYQDASSIFAYGCDQDFFGSYNDDLERGVVSYANHHQVPGKKAWTWGHGSYGTMHQADLTDSDGPYNEVQTGPLLTQGEVGRLDPCEAVEWREWWYPIHGTGGFVFANKNVAVNLDEKNGHLRFQLIGSGSWRSARVSVLKSGRLIGETSCDLNPTKPARFDLPVKNEAGPFSIAIRWGAETVAQWQFPLDLPERKVPEKRPAPREASELVQAGWQNFLFARFSEAERSFKNALEKDSKCAEAHVGLAHIDMDRDEAKSVGEARLAASEAPDSGAAHFILAVAESRLGHGNSALEEAWKAALDPATAVPARALIGELLIRDHRAESAVAALTEAGPWQTDVLCRNRLAMALLIIGKQDAAKSAAFANLAVDPLDAFAEALLWSCSHKTENLGGNVPALLEISKRYAELAQSGDGFKLLDKLYVQWPGSRRNPLLDEWYLSFSDNRSVARQSLSAAFRGRSWPLPRPEDLPDTWPHDYEMLAPLREAVNADAADGQAALALGHLLFRLGRYGEARQQWKHAAALGCEPVVAYRALGMAARTLDGDLNAARDWLEKADRSQPTDAVVARDLASVLSSLAEKAESEKNRRELLSEACERLEMSFDTGRTRADFVSLLAKEQNQLGNFAATARMLDNVRVTVWEGGHEVHDLFEQAHLALGEAYLKEGKASEALAEFDRALEYPANLATGRMENTPDAHIQYQRGRALAALGRQSQAHAAWKLAAESAESSDPRVAEARREARQALGNP